MRELAREAESRAVDPVVFAVTVLGAFMVALDLSIVNVAFPSMRASFPDSSTATLSWVLTAYSVVFGALLLAGGRIADRSGRRRTFFGGLAIFTIGSALCAVAPEPWLLIAGRATQAVGAAALLPASLALLLGASRPDARAAVVSMWGGVSALAVATGPSLGSVLIDWGGWRWAFLVNLPVALVAWLAGRRVLQESAVGGPRPDLVGVVTISAAVAALALGITQGDSWGWTSPAVIGSFAAAAGLAAAAVRRAACHSAPAVDLRLFRSPGVALANAATFFYAIAFFATLLGNILFLTSVWGYSTLRAGLAFTPGPLVVAALSARAGRLAGRIGFRPVLVSGALVLAVAELAYATLVDTTPQYLAVWLPISLLVGLGVALSFPVLSAAAVAGLPAPQFGTGGAINQTARQIGSVIGVAVVVAILGQPTSFDDALQRSQHVWLVCAAMAAISAAVSAFQRPAVERSAAPVLVEVGA
jgi:EmrB/QacA subfamily drug resistance transporter